ncbi:hypothetical protein [Flavobacterium microcysteis]|uniref:Uncharacterized protein n=1 Tax=Flavobacterium microcysteis TaxID=2596891 RepID=A0A501QFS7_9FLAO|nr:hypothetical protein [Flavobacterium microcysteis]TPD71244.1 hypothetical protein FJA49_04920 [Flavobacterium microcysteis]
MKKCYFTLLMLGCIGIAHAQIGIGTTNPHVSTALDVTADDKGILLPRISLTGSTDSSTIATGNVEGLLIFNTATVADVTPGYYYWLGTKWQRMDGRASNGWLLTGNSGTDANMNFLGTTDAQDLTFRTNNVERLRITRKGRLHFSNTSVSPLYPNIFLEGGNETTSGVANIAIGESALANIDSGQQNIAVGRNALKDNSSGLANVAIGNEALGSNTYSLSNVGVGFAALTMLNDGGQNVAIGTNAGSTLPSGQRNTFIGSFAGTTIDGLDNATAIGYQATVEANNSIVLGATGSMAVNVGIGNTMPNSTLQISGSFSAAINSTAVDYAVTDKDYTILYTVSGITITLPPANDSNTGRIYNIVCDIAAGSINLNGGEITKDGSVITSATGSVVLQSTGIKWVVVR